MKLTPIIDITTGKRKLIENQKKYNISDKQAEDLFVEAYKSWYSDAGGNYTQKDVASFRKFFRNEPGIKEDVKKLLYKSKKLKIPMQELVEGFGPKLDKARQNESYDIAYSVISADYDFWKYK